MIPQGAEMDTYPIRIKCQANEIHHAIRTHADGYEQFSRKQVLADPNGHTRREPL